MVFSFTIAVLVLAIARSEIAGERRCAPLPRVVIGCWQLTERFGEEEAISTLTEYALAGFTAFDTADIYGPSERILGAFRARFAARHPETQLRFFTKYVTQDSTVANAERTNRRSREALGVASLDLVQFHWWDFGDAAYVDAARALEGLRRSGRITEVAACNFDAPHLAALLDAGLPIVANQVQYSLLDRRPENAMVPLARARGVQLTCFGAVAGGLLSDAYLGQPEQALDFYASTVSLRMYRSSLQAWSGGGDRGWALFQDLLKTLRLIGDELDCAIAVVSVAWVLDRLDRSCGGAVVLGVRDATHLDDAVKARDLKLSQKHLDAIDAVLSRGNAPTGDIWSRERR